MLKVENALLSQTDTLCYFTFLFPPNHLSFQVEWLCCVLLPRITRGWRWFVTLLTTTKWSKRCKHPPRKTPQLILGTYMPTPSFKILTSSDVCSSFMVKLQQILVWCPNKNKDTSSSSQLTGLPNQMQSKWLAIKWQFRRVYERGRKNNQNFLIKVLYLIFCTKQP